MKYYKVLTDGKYDSKSGYTTIKHELLTECEYNRRFPSISNAHFQIVNVKRTNTYICFGARFECRAE